MSFSSIFPVILKVPPNKHQISIKQRTANLSRLARKALYMSACKSSVSLGRLLKNERGAPIPFNNIFWSISHKPEYVCGVVSDYKTGIDIEKIRPCSEGLFKKIASNKEWDAAGEYSNHNFFRFWTAKEAVLKAEGTGLKDLKKCTIIKFIDEFHIKLFYKGINWTVEHFYFDKHIASIVQNNIRIKWDIV
ncbi:4'-phosphopantetheinyl transferase [Candidatus Magnetomoraceae bacterium gMMP-1]